MFTSSTAPCHGCDLVQRCPRIAKGGRRFYIALVNPDEGSSFVFVQTSLINGVKCAKIDKEDVLPEIEYWKSAVLCSILGVNPLLEVMDGYFRRIWHSMSIDRICLVRKVVYLVRFSNLEDQMNVVKKGVYYFDNKPLLVKPWNPEMEINTESVSSLRIWVRFLDLDIKYWGLTSLGKLGSILEYQSRLIGLPWKIPNYIMLGFLST